MRRRTSFPIRLKILVTLLMVVTTVVSVITFTMATMFHEDKTAYMTDLTSMVAIGAADECRSILRGYADQLSVYRRVLERDDMPSHAKHAIVEGFFGDFTDLLGVIVYDDGEEASVVFDQNGVDASGISTEQLDVYVADHRLAIADMQPGDTRIENSAMSATLPTFTLSVATEDALTARTRVVSAVISLDALTRVTRRTGVFELYLVDGDGRIFVHDDITRVMERAPAELPADAATVTGALSIGTAVKFTRGDKRLIGGFAPVDVDGLIVAAEIPNSVVYLASRSLLVRMVVVALVLLAFAVFFSQFGADRITKPLQRLMQAAGKIGKGEFDVDVDVQSADEIGALGGAFNQMATELRDREAALDEAQEQLVQSEKMAAFGQIGAGIAHEVKNPLAGILGNAQLALRKTPDDDPTRRYLELIEKETKRCTGIVTSLLKFARREKVAKVPIDINAPVAEAIAIVHHQLEMQHVKLTSTLAENLPTVMGDANQIQQVLMNLMINAQQAMEGAPGSVTVETHLRPDRRVEIVVSDTGPGMTAEVQRKIFEPFYTTKPGGKGTGLGLSVSFGIVKDHEGSLLLESAPGQGATFRIVLPSHEAGSHAA